MICHGNVKVCYLIGLMHILLFHPVKLPPVHYGGTERVALWLMRTLASMGHKITAHAEAGSLLPAGIELISDPEILRARASEFDLVHSFTKLSPDWYECFRQKVIVTIHGNGQKNEKFHKNTVFISRNHAERHGAKVFVYNGLDPSELEFNSEPRPDRFLFLSKTSWKVKNLSGAMTYADQARQNLWVAGGERPFHLRARLFAQKLTGKDWRWVGAVTQAEKAHFLTQGKALIFPVLWNEPFGLVMVEALLSGTPVLANPYGSVPEILEFAPQCLLSNESSWLAALKGEIKLPSAKECREWALSKFDQKIMAREYLKLYERVASGEMLNEHDPMTKVGADEI